MSRLLVVVDYQKDFVNGTLAAKDAELIEDKIYDKVEEYLKAGDKVVFTKDTHQRGTYMASKEGQHLPVGHCFEGEDGWMLYGKLGVFDHERANEVAIINKGTFGSLTLGAEARFGYEEIELCGVVTNICVVSNAAIIKAYAPDTEVIVDASCCASNDRKLHYKALDVMASFQVQIKNDDRNVLKHVED